MNKLKIIQPIALTEEMMPTMVVPDVGSVESTNVPENEHDAWDDGTSYDAEVRVIFEHNVYESLQGSNTGKTPDEQPLWWVKVGPTNRWAPFDQSPSTVCTYPEQIWHTITPGIIINAVAVLGVSALTVRVVVTDPADGVVYDETKGVAGVIDSPDWWTYFFGDVSGVTDALFLDLPTYGSAAITIEIDAGEGEASVGTIILGRLRLPDLAVQYGVELGIVDFSRKERDDFGAIQLVQRGFARRAEFPCYCATSSVDNVVNLLAALRSTPCVWIGTEKTLTTIVYGWYNDFSIQISYPQISYCSLEVEGLV